MEHMTTKEGRAAIREFFAALGRRCSSVPDGENCPACDMRLFCYAAPPDKTAMIDQVISFLENRDQAVSGMVETTCYPMATSSDHKAPLSERLAKDVSRMPLPAHDQ